jgi:undecaprenyl-diphosphatase
VLFVKIILLAILQGACELLPVSSSAHVIIAEKLMGIDPVSPEMTLLLVMLHTGTMLAVIIYFWRSWKRSFFESRDALAGFALSLLAATFLTGALGLALKVVIEKILTARGTGAEVELIFGNLGIVSLALAAAGILIIYSGAKAGSGNETRSGKAFDPRKGRSSRSSLRARSSTRIPLSASVVIGAVQALCLPFRGFSRSGATISTGLLAGLSRRAAEEFSFALAVVLTPPVIYKEVHRLLRSHTVWNSASDGAGGSAPAALDLLHLFLPSALGMAASFLAGLLALKWLSSWLEAGRWSYFGYYCLALSALTFALYARGF